METKMQVTQAKLLRRRTHAQYEHSEIELIAELSLTRPLQEQLAELRLEAEAALYPEREIKTPTKVEAPKVEKVEEVKEEVKAPKAKAPAKAKAEVAKVEEVKEEVSEVEGQDIPPVIPDEAKAKKGTKEKVVLYDSSIPSHKKKLAETLSSLKADWKVAPESMEQATYNDQIRTFTGSLNGSNFEDINGDVLESFKQKISAWFVSVGK